MTLATIQDKRPRRQGRLVLAPAPTEPTGHPGERSRPPLDADATCHAVTGPITPTVPNRAVTTAAAAPTAASTSRHGEPRAFGTTWSTPANRATTRKCTRTTANRAAHRRNDGRGTFDANHDGLAHRHSIENKSINAGFSTSKDPAK